MSDTSTNTKKVELIKKITKHFKRELSGLLAADPEKLIAFAGEISIKQRIIRLLPHLRITEGQCEYLLQRDLPLDCLYNMCMQCMVDRVIDCACAQAICESVDEE